MAKEIDSIHHHGTRAHIPSKEEAGYENASNKVAQGKETLELPLNPVTHRGQDPELYWMNKYGNDDREELLKVDIRSLYRYEHIAPEKLIAGLYKVTEEKRNEDQFDIFAPNKLFGNALEYDELEKVSEYYKHSDGWTNRLIQGDSLLVMGSLLEREGMAGQVQCIYMDPPYGIKYNSNWQMKLNDRNIKDGNDEHLTGEPEQIKAFRDTWIDGVHSYLSYLRDRLLIAKELLTESGSCFVQISDENVHLVRNIMDEVFGSENFVSQINFRTTAGDTSNILPTMGDYILWYSFEKTKTKYRKIFQIKELGAGTGDMYNYIESPDGKTYRRLTNKEILNTKLIPEGWRPFRIADLKRLGFSRTATFTFKFNGNEYYCGDNYQWKTSPEGMERLKNEGWLIAPSNTLSYKRYFEHFPISEIGNFWSDTQGASTKEYVVQTSNKVIQRCILMSTDPGDIVLDPTCGSGTTAYIAEQWGRKWITIDTSRIALNVAKQRLMTATFPYYKLYDEENRDIRQGFKYKSVPHITLRDIANNEPPAEETLYDQPYEDNKKLRVSGPFTVETLQNYEPLNPENLDDGSRKEEDSSIFEERIFEHLKSAGVKNGIKNEQAVFIRVERLADSALHAEGFYNTGTGERKAYFHIGPKFGTVSKLQVNEAVKACRIRGDADWLIILGFSFESDIANQSVTMNLGSFEVTKVRMHDDLMQDGLLKKDKKAASFVTIGEPDVKLHKEGNTATVEICGLDIYDPIKDVVNARNVEDIAYWMLDTEYDGSNFVLRQVFFCGGSKNEFTKWQKGLESLSKQKTKRNAEITLKIEIDDEAFDRLYGFQSHPFEIKPGQKIAVRVISQFGEESTKVLGV